MLLTKVIVISYKIPLTIVPFTLTLSAFQIFKERPPRLVEVSKIVRNDFDQQRRLVTALL